MANKLYEESDVQAIATAIRAKNGTSNTYKVSQMAAAINDLPSGTTISNGRIVEKEHSLYSSYSSATSIPAGKFVQFAHFLSTDLYGSGGSYFEAAPLSSSSFLIASYRNYSSTYRITAIVGSVSGNTIEYGTMQEMQISSYLSRIKIVKISESEALLLYRIGTSVYCVSISINGTEIQFGTPETILDNNSSYGDYLEAILFNTNTIVLLTTISNTLKLLPFQYSNGVYTIGEPTEVFNSYSGNYSLCETSSQGMLIIYLGTNTKFCCKAATLSGTTITLGNETVIDSNFNGAFYFCCHNYDDGKAIIFYKSYAITSSLVYRVITVDGTNVTLGTLNGMVSPTYGIGDGIKVCKVSGKRFFISAYDSVANLHTILGTFNDSDRLTVNKHDTFVYNRNSSYGSIPIVMNSSLVILFTGDTGIDTYKSGRIACAQFNIAGTSYSIYSKVQLPVNTINGCKKIDGFTLEEITTSTPGDVYVFNG